MKIDLFRYKPSHDTSRSVAILDTDVTLGYKGANTVTEESSLPSKGSLNEDCRTHNGASTVSCLQYTGR